MKLSISFIQSASIIIHFLSRGLTDTILALICYNDTLELQGLWSILNDCNIDDLERVQCLTIVPTVSIRAPPPSPFLAFALMTFLYLSFKSTAVLFQ